MRDDTRALMGTETEYALTALDAAGQPVPLSGVTNRILKRATARQHLSGEEAGVFLSNAARCYIDAGAHPEYAAPETTDPWAAVRYTLAGDRLMAQLVREAAQDGPALGGLGIRKGNVDYATSATFASHENYLYRCPPSRMRPALVPHLVSRVVLTGGGGFDPFDRARPRFVLSPRALFMRQAVALSAPGGLALVDERNQPLCAGYERQHVICGDANQSQLSLFLRLGTTALVVALIDARVDQGEEVTLADPLAALRTVTRDATLRRTLATCSGRRLTAIAIQRHYLRQARRHLPRLPPWAPEVCDIWDATLSLLGQGPTAVSDRLDWAIKLAIVRDRAARTGRRWPSRPATAASAGSSRTATAGAGWRAELCEIDLLYARLEPPGLFDALDRDGVLHHRVNGIDDIDTAVVEPPPGGRARVRGTVIAALAHRGTVGICGWARIHDQERRRILDLSDPFAAEERWHELPAEGGTAGALIARILTDTRRDPSPEGRSATERLCERLSASGATALMDRTGDHAMTLNNRACDLRAAGRFDEAEWLMRAALAIDLDVRSPHHPKVPHRRNNLATVLLMQGRFAEAREQMSLAWAHFTTRYDLTSARILTMRLALALVDGESPLHFIGQLKTLLAIGPVPDFADVDRRWNVDRILSELAHRMDPEGFIVGALAVALNGDRTVESLDDCRLWKETPPAPLTMPWPHPDA